MASHISSAGVRAVSTAPVASAREAQNETDPMRRMWDALAVADCKPHGEPYKFRACCPVHGGTNAEALQVYEGSDRRVVFGCYAHGCDKRAILDALGLRWADMFPAGHKSAERRKPVRPVEPRPLSLGAAFLDAMTAAGFRWAAHVMRQPCPYCSNPHAYIVVHDAGGLDVECPDGCLADEVRRAVETRAAIAEKGLDL